MARQEATEEELQAIWDQVSDFWDKQNNKLSFPWAEAKFKLSVFKTTLAQKNLRIPYRLGLQ